MFSFLLSEVGYFGALETKREYELSTKRLIIDDDKQKI